MPLSTKQIQLSYNLNPVPATGLLSEIKKLNENAMEYFGCYPAFKAALKALPEIEQSAGALVGIEVEVENVNLDLWEHTIAGWSVTKDSSLRNNGAEFISVPLPLECVPQAITALYLTLKKGQKATPDFSWRTSLHVHLNVRTLTPNQVAALLVAYLVFEQEFFAFAGQKRDRVNFCVPLSDTTLSTYLREFFAGKRSLGDLCEIWHKYAAANVIPLAGSTKDVKAGKKGTIEFRHMGGTADPIRVVQWINLLVRLHRHASLNSFEVTKQSLFEIKSKLGYEKFKKLVFGDCESYFPKIDESFPYSGLLFAKECCTVYEEPPTPTDFGETGLMEMVQKRHTAPKKSKFIEQEEWLPADTVLNDFTQFPAGGLEAKRIIDGKFFLIYAFSHVAGSIAKVVACPEGGIKTWYHANKFLVKLASDDAPAWFVN